MALVRLRVVVGVTAALVGGVAWWVAREDAPGGRTAEVSRGSVPPVTARAALAAPAGPSLPPLPALPAPPASAPTLPPGPPAPPAGEPYAAQDRDPAWAGATETEIGRRLARLRVPLDAVECRHDLCELRLAGDAEAISAALAQLETPDGLLGVARSITLTAPEQQGGRMTLRAYARFER